DPPNHGRVRGLASKAFTARRVEGLRSHIQDITKSLLDAVQDQGRMDVIADLAYPLPAIVTAEMLGVPTSDWQQLTAWSADFAQVLGNFQHTPETAPRVMRSLQEMIVYLQAAVRKSQPAYGTPGSGGCGDRRQDHSQAAGGHRRDGSSQS